MVLKDDNVTISYLTRLLFSVTHDYPPGDVENFKIMNCGEGYFWRTNR